MFPRGVPPLVTSLHVYETGLTDPQMVALLAGVQVLRPNFTDHSRRICVILYEKYPQFLRIFRQQPADNHRLHAHSEHMLRFFGSLIEFGLYNMDMYKQMLAQFVAQHRQHGLDRTDIENVTHLYREYISAVLERHMSESLASGLRIFFAAIAAAFGEPSSSRPSSNSISGNRADVLSSREMIK